MSYTIKPKEKHAKARSTLFISPKDALIICRAIRKKKLTTARRLLEDLDAKKRSLGGKYYSHAVSATLRMLKSCEKNAENLGLEMGRLFVYASASYGPNMRRRRRRSDFGHLLKVTNLEIVLAEQGKETGARKPEAKKENKLAKTETKKVEDKEGEKKAAKEEKPVKTEEKETKDVKIQKPAEKEESMPKAKNGKKE